MPAINKYVLNKVLQAPILVFMKTYQNYLSTIFPDKQNLYLCNGFKDGRAIDPYVGDLTSAPNLQFYSINPTSGHRSSATVTEYRNFLFESDTIALDVQKDMINELVRTFPIRLVTFSGSKSYHIIVSLADTPDVEPGSDIGTTWYKAAWKAIASELTELSKKSLWKLGVTLPDDFLFDTSCSDPSRLSRTPLALRNELVVQTVLHEQGKLLSVAELTGLMNKHQDKSKKRVQHEIIEEVDYMALESFEKLLFVRQSLHYIKLQFEQERNWQAPSGHYNKLFKLALWVYESTGVPKETLLTYLQKHTFPVILASGYPRDPARAIHDAYNFKKGQ